jgi:predicted HAD superfamily phosphohydrolase YqeG
MLDNGNTILEYKIEDWLQEGKQYPRIMIKDEIKLLVYNNRNIPQINLK